MNTRLWITAAIVVGMMTACGQKETTSSDHKDHVYFQEFTSDTIFRLNERLEGEPVYVVGKGDQIHTPKP